jgi:hypothetical protein
MRASVVTSSKGKRENSLVRVGQAVINAVSTRRLGAMLHGCGQGRGRPHLDANTVQVPWAALLAGTPDFTGTMPVVSLNIDTFCSFVRSGAAHVMHASAFVYNRPETLEQCKE